MILPRNAAILAVCNICKDFLGMQKVTSSIDYSEIPVKTVMLWFKKCQGLLLPAPGGQSPWFSICPGLWHVCCSAEELYSSQLMSSWGFLQAKLKHSCSQWVVAHSIKSLIDFRKAFIDMLYYSLLSKGINISVCLCRVRAAESGGWGVGITETRKPFI